MASFNVGTSNKPNGPDLVFPGGDTSKLWPTFLGSNRKRCISPITSDNWNDAKLSGSFTRHGHLVIFYVTEDIEKEPGVYHPVVNTIDIEVGVTKNYKTSEVEHTYIGRVERESKCVPNEIEYLIKNVYSKYAIPSYASQQFMSDYIFSVGDYPKNYNLTITVDETNTFDQASYKFKSNFFGNNKAHRADVNKTESDESASEMFYYDPNNGFHLKSEYVVTVQKYDEVLDKYVDVDKSDW